MGTRRRIRGRVFYLPSPNRLCQQLEAVQGNIWIRPLERWRHKHFLVTLTEKDFSADWCLGRGVQVEEGREVLK
ncbi:unnamed protein product [Blepharisma stoltei]|uniref:DUF4283 domain-containing protein n=1 Tax=Blepharisma stoltei TaxID=1481888 RepID=A0AAU9J3P2_9CILI|nr:unnamed protein product [Blepharisma stoltei]